MIKEAYCSFEVAKLLKEKRFNWDCITYYVDSEPNKVQYSMLFENNTTWEERCCSAPTHQMAMKWLMEVKGLFIAINCDDLNYNWQVFDVHHRDKNGEPICQSESFGGYYNFKKATDDAIKYCLEKLIL